MFYSTLDYSDKVITTITLSLFSIFLFRRVRNQDDRAAALKGFCFEYFQKSKSLGLAEKKEYPRL